MTARTRIGREMTDYATEWVCEVGTEPPAFDGSESPWDFLDNLKALPWADSVRWAERINGAPLLPGQIRKLQRAHGFDSWKRDAKKTAVNRRAFGRPGWNEHNAAVSRAANRLRFRVLCYCLAAWRRAVKSGADWSLVTAFKAGCARIFGRQQPYANRSRVKAFRDWIEAKLTAEKLLRTPTAAFNNAGRGMCDAAPLLGEDNRNMTHRPGGSDAAGGTDGSGDGDGIPAFGGQRAAPSVPPEGLRPSRLSPGPTPCSTGGKWKATVPVGIARTALPTLAQAHRDAGGEAGGLLPWHEQRRWALGWLAAWVRKGCDVHRLAEIYATAVRSFEKRYRKDGYTLRDGHRKPWALRGHLQERARSLPRHAAEWYRDKPRAFPRTVMQIEDDRMRDDRRAAVRRGETPEHLREWVEHLANFRAEKPKSEPANERAAWARDLGWAA